MTNSPDPLAALKKTAADLEVIDQLRAAYVAKRDLLIRDAFEKNAAPRMHIAMAAGLTMSRTYGISAEQSINAVDYLLSNAPADMRRIPAARVHTAEEANEISWVAFPDPDAAE